MAGVNVLFSLMDLGALHSGVFRFRHPDLLGLPIYEFFMWGFYTLNALRFVGRMPETPRLTLSLVLAALLFLPFATVAQPIVLFCTYISVDDETTRILNRYFDKALKDRLGGIEHTSRIREWLIGIPVALMVGITAILVAHYLLGF